MQNLKIWVERTFLISLTGILLGGAVYKYGFSVPGRQEQAYSDEASRLANEPFTLENAEQEKKFRSMSVALAQKRSTNGGRICCVVAACVTICLVTLPCLFALKFIRPND